MNKIVLRVKTKPEAIAQIGYDREWDAAYRVYKKAIEPYWLEFTERLARAKEVYNEAVGK